jgi:hypothetical protein
MQIDPILPSIEDALERYGVSQTAFGYTIANDPALVPKMRGGRRLRAAMRGKVQAALDKLNKEGTL